MILKQYNSDFVSYEIPPGIYTIRDISEAVYTKSHNEGFLQIEYDDIGMKTKIVWLILMVCTEEDNFFADAVRNFYCVYVVPRMNRKNCLIVKLKTCIKFNGENSSITSQMNLCLWFELREAGEGWCYPTGRKVVGFWNFYCWFPMDVIGIEVPKKIEGFILIVFSKNLTHFPISW